MPDHDLPPSTHAPSPSAADLEGARPGTPENFAYNLLTLEESRESLLNDEEYKEMRASILSSISGQKSSLRDLLSFLSVAGLGSLAVSGFGLLADKSNFVLGGVFAFSVVLLSVAIVYRHERAAEGLTNEERLLIIDQLTSWGLLSTEESDTLRTTNKGR